MFVKKNKGGHKCFFGCYKEKVIKHKITNLSYHILYL